VAADEATFETSFAELEQVVGRLQDGGLSLEESMALFERGMALARQCSEHLERAELRLRRLLGDGSLEDLPPIANDGTSQ
jgi:exodeoxyribonuclease VII small subunit